MGPSYNGYYSWLALRELGFESLWLHMYKKISKEEFAKAFDNAVEKAFSEDEVGETGVLIKAGDMVMYTSREFYEEFKTDVIRQSLKPDGTIEEGN